MSDAAPLAPDDALAKLDARPVALLRRLLYSVLWIGGRAAGRRSFRAGAGYRAGPVRDAPERPPILAFADVIAAMDAGRYRYVGTRREGLSPVGIRCDLWISPDDTAYVMGRQSRSHDPNVLAIARYYIVSTFDDGTCIETVSLTVPLVESSEELAYRGGSDDPAVDAQAHAAAVARRCEARGCRVIPVRDHATAMRLSRFYYRHVVGLRTARALLGIFAAPFIIILGIVLLLRG